MVMKIINLWFYLFLFNALPQISYSQSPICNQCWKKTPSISVHCHLERFESSLFYFFPYLFISSVQRMGGLSLLLSALVLHWIKPLLHLQSVRHYITLVVICRTSFLIWYFTEIFHFTMSDQGLLRKYELYFMTRFGVVFHKLHFRCINDNVPTFMEFVVNILFLDRTMTKKEFRLCPCLFKPFQSAN